MNIFMYLVLCITLGILALLIGHTLLMLFTGKGLVYLFFFFGELTIFGIVIELIMEESSDVSY